MSFVRNDQEGLPGTTAYLVQDVWRCGGLCCIVNLFLKNVWLVSSFEIEWRTCDNAVLLEIRR